MKYNAWVKLQDTAASEYIMLHIAMHACTIACCDFKRKLDIYFYTTYLVLEPKDHPTEDSNLKKYCICKKVRFFASTFIMSI